MGWKKINCIKNKEFNAKHGTNRRIIVVIDEAYELFENKRDGVIKVKVEC